MIVYDHKTKKYVESKDAEHTHVWGCQECCEKLTLRGDGCSDEQAAGVTAHWRKKHRGHFGIGYAKVDTDYASSDVVDWTIYGIHRFPPDVKEEPNGTNSK